MARKFRRVFQMDFCGDWLEIYRQTPRPKNEGEFLFSFRERRKREVLPIMTGLTAGGVEVITKSLTQPPGFKLSETLTRLCLAIGEKMKYPRFARLTLS